MRPRKHLRPCCILILLLLAVAGTSRRPHSAAAWKPIKAEDFKMKASDTGDPDAEAAILFREGDLNDDSADGTSLRVYVRLKIFSEAGRRYGDVQLSYRPGEVSISDVHARTVRPDGVTIEVESRNIFDKLVSKTARGVSRAKVFTLPGVEVGSIIEYRYRQTYPSGFRYFAFDLQSDLFIKELHYSIQPQSLSRLDVKWITINGDDKRFAPVWNGTYQIKVDNIAPFHREALMPPEGTVKTWGWLYYSKQSEKDADKYWVDYGRRVYPGARAETQPTRLIRRVVRSITVSTDTPQQKIQRIYDYVQREVENVANMSAESRELEKLELNNSADLTLKRRRGTAKEINRLFIAMLRAAGLNAHVAELTTRDENFFHRYFTDSFQFNSEITAIVPQDGAVQFLDPTAEHCPAGMLPWEKESVPALVYGKHNPRFVETPITQASDSAEDRLLTVCATEGGDLKIHEQNSFSGQRALDLRNSWFDLSEDGLRKTMAARFLDGIPSARFDEATLKIDGLKQPGRRFSVSCDYAVTGGAQVAGKIILLGPAAFLRSNAPVFTPDRRFNDIYFHYPLSEHDRMIIQPPDGYEVEQLPPPVDLDLGAAKYKIRYLREGTGVVVDRYLVLNAIRFEAGSYQAVKTFFDRVSQADRAYVGFSRIR